MRQDVAPAIGLGLALHQYFKRNEPYPFKALVTILGSDALLQAALQCDWNVTLRGVMESSTITAVALLASIAVYRLSPWHPLARYPGPWLHKLTKLRKYGPSFESVPPNELSIADAAAVQPVYSGLPKDRWYRGRSPRDGGRSILALTGMWDRGLGQEQLLSYTESAERVAKQVVAHLDVAADKGVAVNLTQWVRFFAMTSCPSSRTFGKESGMTLTGQDPDGMIKKMSNVLVATDVNAHTVTYDLWHYLMDKDAPHKLTTIDLIREAAAGVIAGADTVANATICTVYLLLKNPRCMARVKSEVDRIVSSGSEPWADIEVHKDLPYLNACIDESLRLLSVVPVIGSRSVPAGSGGKIIASHFVPENTEVYVPPCVLHVSEKYFSPEPLAYHPERWLASEDHAGKWHTNRDAFIPFSVGAQNCVGKNLARIEMVLFLSMLIHQYDMSFAPDFDVEGFPDTMQEHVVAEVGPMTFG
ncbi:high nitrogen upregulated cytochrome P450 monooxygenase 2 [Auriculariales sp. MPI-PUGE-AT-0066]|nr:high nitrogen upregulated cytochrome P450 monooxygenase 2 [Auriculariales sp. MPI-PUGE-AT-0066]